jgi:putative membrane protein
VGTWMHGECAACRSWMGGWHVAGWALTALLLIGFVALLALVITREIRGRSDEDAAASILAERYARGEIDTEEFEHRRRQLR